MVFVAPLISQSLMRHEYTPAADSQHHHSYCETRPAAHADNAPSERSAPMDEHAACGYCVLLSQSPLLLSTILNATAARFTVTTLKAATYLDWQGADSGYRRQRPRAPPAHPIPHQYR